ncbi:MAG: hypothetical protein KBB30_01200 [Bacteroidales bacterium]|jgi:hypothetical protein|nr:hypothetical protein [Bacteroidales bacterium]
MNNDQERQQIKQTVKDIIRLRCKVQKKTPMEVIREMQYELDEMKERHHKMSLGQNPYAES